MTHLENPQTKMPKNDTYSNVVHPGPAVHKLLQAILSTYAASLAQTDFRKLSTVLVLNELVPISVCECFGSSI